MFSFLTQKHDEMDLSISLLKEMIEEDRGVIIDVRTENEYNSGHLKLTDHHYNFLDGEFAEKLEDLEKDETYYLYCRTGNRSAQAAKKMKDAGFTRAYNIGGFQELANAGFETE
jgi:phage shock protein E